jgi:hypothetical protein
MDQNQEMVILESKTKSMVINFTKKYQFQPRLTLNGQNIQVVDKMKILGTVLTNSLSWNENCSRIIKKVNARMQLLRKVWSFGSNNEEMVHLWKTFCLSILEQSCVVWNNGLTAENESDLERTQKTFCKLVLEEKYVTYFESLQVLGLQTLKERRKMLSLRFIKQSLADVNFHDLFPKRKKLPTMGTRKPKNSRYSMPIQRGIRTPQ